MEERGSIVGSMSGILRGGDELDEKGRREDVETYSEMERKEREKVEEGIKLLIYS